MLIRAWVQIFLRQILSDLFSVFACVVHQHDWEYKHTERRSQTTCVSDDDLGIVHEAHNYENWDTQDDRPNALGEVFVILIYC